MVIAYEQQTRDTHLNERIKGWTDKLSRLLFMFLWKVSRYRMVPVRLSWTVSSKGARLMWVVNSYYIF